MQYEKVYRKKVPVYQLAWCKSENVATLMLTVKIKILLTCFNDQSGDSEIINLKFSTK